MRSLQSLAATRIVVAHRLSTARAADRVVVVSGGRIVEGGTRDELAAAGGTFARLAARHTLSELHGTHRSGVVRRRPGSNA